jgi:Rod binding domain-containing protein
MRVPSSLAPVEREPNRLTKAAHEFEAMLLSTLLEASGSGLLGLPGPSDPQSDSYGSLARQSLSSALAASGGLGLANIILHAMDSTKVISGVRAGPATMPSGHTLPWGN